MMRIAGLLLPLIAVGALATDDIPRTASGRPDLSGSYDIANLTPFQREPKFGDRALLSAAEAQEIERTEAAVMARLGSSSDPNRSAPPVAGDGSPGAAGEVGGYNAFWIDRGNASIAIDGEYRTSILVDPKNGRLPPMTAAGEKRRAAQRQYVLPNKGTAWWLEQPVGPYDDPESLPLSERCIYVGPAVVPMLPLLYNNLKTIVQTETHVMILVEWMHDARIIRLDSEHAPPEVRSLAGDSIGWWEGDTLVVETTNFLERPNVPRDGLRVVERFSRLGKEALLYHFTIHDPDYTAPYSGELPWPQTKDRLFEYACHEGNYAMGNILRGARLLEREALAGKAQSSGEP